MTWCTVLSTTRKSILHLHKVGHLAIKIPRYQKSQKKNPSTEKKCLQKKGAKGEAHMSLRHGSAPSLVHRNYDTPRPSQQPTRSYTSPCCPLPNICRKHLAHIDSHLSGLQRRGVRPNVQEPVSSPIPFTYQFHGLLARTSAPCRATSTGQVRLKVH